MRTKVSVVYRIRAGYLHGIVGPFEFPFCHVRYTRSAWAYGCFFLYSFLGFMFNSGRKTPGEEWSLFFLVMSSSLELDWLLAGVCCFRSSRLFFFFSFLDVPSTVSTPSSATCSFEMADMFSDISWLASASRRFLFSALRSAFLRNFSVNLF